MYTQQVFKKSLNGFDRAQVLNYIYEQDYIAEQKRQEQENEITLLLFCMYTQQVFKKSLNGFDRAQVLNYIYEQDYIAEQKRQEQENEITLLTQQLNAKTSQLKKLEGHAEIMERHEEEMLQLREALIRSEQEYKMLQQEHELLQSRLTGYLTSDEAAGNAPSESATVDGERVSQLETEVIQLRRRNEELEQSIRSGRVGAQSNALMAQQESEIRRLREKTKQMTELIEAIRVRFDEMQASNQQLSMQLADTQNINSMHMEQLRLQSGQILEKDRALREVMLQLDQHRQTIEKQEESLKQLVENHNQQIQKLNTEYTEKLTERDAIIGELQKSEEMYKVELIGKQQQLDYAEKMLAAQKQQLEQKEQQLLSLQRTNSIQQSQLIQKDEQIKLFKYMQQEQKRDLDIKLQELTATKKLLAESTGQQAAQVDAAELGTPVNAEASAEVSTETPAESESKPKKLKSFTTAIADFLNVASGNAPTSTVKAPVAGLPTYNTVSNFPVGQNSTQTVPAVQQLLAGVSLNSSMVSNSADSTDSRPRQTYGVPFLATNQVNGGVIPSMSTPITEIPIGLPAARAAQAPIQEKLTPKEIPIIPEIPVVDDGFNVGLEESYSGGMMDSGLEQLVSELKGTVDWETEARSDIKQERARLGDPNDLEESYSGGMMDSGLEQLVSELKGTVDWETEARSDIKQERARLGDPNDDALAFGDSENTATPYFAGSTARPQSSGTHARLTTFSEGDENFESEFGGARQRDIDTAAAPRKTGTARMIMQDEELSVPAVIVGSSNRESRSKRFEGILPNRSDGGLFKVSNRPSIGELRRRN